MKSENVSQDNGHAEYVEKLLDPKFGSARFEVWKYFEDNADKLELLLWDQGKWLLAIQGGVLFLPFMAQMITPTPSLPFMTTRYLLLIVVLYGFGVVLSFYSLGFQKEIGEHISRNFDRAILAREGSPGCVSQVKQIKILYRTTMGLIVAYVLVFALLTIGRLSTG